MTSFSSIQETMEMFEGKEVDHFSKTSLFDERIVPLPLFVKNPVRYHLVSLILRFMFPFAEILDRVLIF